MFCFVLFFPSNPIVDFGLDFVLKTSKDISITFLTNSMCILNFEVWVCEIFEFSFLFPGVEERMHIVWDVMVVSA